MRKFKEGDIIVKNGCTFVCRIVGETESYFEQRWFKGLFKYPENAWGYSGCGGDGPEFACTNHIILFSDKSKYDIVSKSSNKTSYGCCVTNHYPVIGSHISCSPISIYNNTLKDFYKDDYKKYIDYLHSEINVKEEIKEEVKKKKK